MLLVYTSTETYFNLNIKIFLTTLLLHNINNINLCLSLILQHYYYHIVESDMRIMILHLNIFLIKCES